jgi:hypothetical protein
MMAETNITGLPYALAAFVFAFSFFAFLGSQLISDLPELGEKSFFFGGRFCSVDMCLLASANLEYIGHI